MSFEVFTTSRFEKSAKALLKRYRSLKGELLELIALLETNPLQGVELSPGLRKIRISIKSKGKGKSGGARVISYNVLSSSVQGKVYLIDIYDKSEHDTIDVSKLQRMLDDL